MRRILIILILTSIVSLSLAMLGQPRQTQTQAPRQGAAAVGATRTAAAATIDVNGRKWDAHDFAGIWIRRGGNRAFGPPASIPPLTKQGEEAIKTRIPGPGYSRHPLVKSVDYPEDSNDPAFSCNPKGFPRILLDTAHDYNEVITLPDRILQMWQEARVPREIWLDGRALPTGEDLENLGPAWYGHSVGKWQKPTDSSGPDELVVNTVGLDERAWLDQYAFPKSFDGRIEERYRMTDPNTLELRLTLYDSKYYTRPWVSDVKVWKKEARKNVTWFGWYGLFSGLGELLCAPMNANDHVSGKKGG